MAKELGTNRGRGGSMHIADPNVGIFGANGIVAAGLPIAVGAATAAQLRADGSVVVRAESVAAWIEFEVADTGDGIAPEERERVFTAFYRGGTDSARTSPGAGLGLAVSRAIVEAHGGRIWLADAAVGTRVKFSLPAA